LHGGQVDLGRTDGVEATGAVSWFNNVFNRVAISIDPNRTALGDPTRYIDLSFQAYNNLFRGGSWFHLMPIAATAGNWTMEDNLFDKVNFVQDTEQPLDFDYNAYAELSQEEVNNLSWQDPWVTPNSSRL